MNREEFDNITAQVMHKLLDDFEEKGMSTKAAIAATMTMSLFSSNLSDYLFSGSDEITIEPDKEV